MKGVRADIFWGNLIPVLGKLLSSTFDKKRMIPYISFSVLTKLSGTDSIVYINENCQAGIIFNNLGIWSLVGIWSQNYIFPWQSAGNVHMSGNFQSNLK